MCRIRPLPGGTQERLYTIATGGVNPDAWLAVAGALAGGLSGAIEASLTGVVCAPIVAAAASGN